MEKDLKKQILEYPKLFNKRGYLNGNITKKPEFKESDLVKNIINSTNNIKPNMNLIERIFLITNDSVIPTCKCGKRINRFINYNKGYANHCSKACGDSTGKIKREQTMMELYGSKSFTSTPDFNKKLKETSLKKYGTDFPTQSLRVREKISNTKKQLNYDEITSKKKKTCIEKYGVDSYSKTNEFIERMSVTLSNTEKNKRVSKIKKTKLKRYNDENYNNQEKAIQTSLDRNGTPYYGQRNLSNNTLMKLNDRDWLVKENKTKTLTKISEDLGVSISLVSKHFRIHKIVSILHPVEYNRRSNAEVLLSSYIENELNLQIRTSVRDIIKPYELDIYIPEKSLAIEYNGRYWHSPMNNGGNLGWFIYHQNKIELCNINGIKLLHLWEDYGNHKNLIDDAINGIINNDLLTVLKEVKWT